MSCNSSTIDIHDGSSSWPKDVRPPIMTFNPCIWVDFFTSFSLDDEVQEKYAEAIDTLKEEVRSMLTAKANTTLEKLVLIDTVERLGLAYHFEQEIEEQLQEIFKFHNEESDDLFTTSLQFRLLRQHRHHMSCGVFNQFKSELDNKFKETLNNDVKGLLSLYEAAHVRFRGEDILEEAETFTTHHLNIMLQELEPPLQDQVKRALEQPIHKGYPRIEIRYFISSYEKDSSKNELLLKLAKLDYNYLQNIYKNELSEVSRWWINMDPKSMPHVRDRIIESHFFVTSLCFEPQYSYCRIIGAKALQMTAILDDTYDNRATLEEAELFTDLLQRWALDEVDQLPVPHYLKVVCRSIASIYDDFERDAIEKGKSWAVSYAKEEAKLLGRAYHKELQWFYGREKPSFQEYLANTIITTCPRLYYTMLLLGVESASKEIFDWMISDPKIVIAVSDICRLLDDRVSFGREKNRASILTPVDIYMKQHNVSVQEALDKFAALADDAWKDATAEWVANTSIPNNIVMMVLNYGRGSELYYRTCQDGYTNSEQLQPYTTALYVDPIIM